MGQHFHGLCYTSAEVCEGTWLDLGYCRQTDEMCTLLPNWPEDVHGKIGIVVCQRNGQTTWGTSEHCIRQRSLIHTAVLAIAADSTGHTVKNELSLSPSNRWSVGENHTFIRGLVCWITWALGVTCFHWWSSRIITITTRTLGWHHTRLCMVRDARHNCVWCRMESQWCLGQDSYSRPLRKWRWYRIECVQFREGINLMQIRGGGHLSSRQVIMYSLELHLQPVLGELSSWESWVLDSSSRTRSQGGLHQRRTRLLCHLIWQTCTMYSSYHS